MGGVLAEYPILIVMGVPMIAATFGTVVGLARAATKKESR